VPKGTHDWQKFLMPGEIAAFLDGTDLMPGPPVGVSYNPISGQWALSDDTDVNYMVVAKYPVTAAF
jgi:2-polyprenyl-6-hydroxyphenyl methylase/3-demethylubiquinone-9 3-methyltransferase